MSVITPGSSIGIIGGGQLGRMLAQAAQRMGYRAHIFCPEADAPALEVTHLHTVAAYSDIEALKRFAGSVAAVTFEFENIPAASLAAIESICPIRPGAALLAMTQNRLREKEFANKLGIGTAPFRPVTSAEEAKTAAAALSVPCILKTTEMGYDGKGQVKITDASQVQAAWESLKTQEAILEGFVDFACEVSVIVARNERGEMRCFPVVENIHKNHILHQTIAPARIDAGISARAQAVAEKIAQNAGLVGLLAIEMFITKGGEVLVNELAPRPHNSGHWTLDACATSQFEQCIRAVCGLPLGSTDVLRPAIMTNLIGDDIAGWEVYLSDADTKLHLYGKREARPGRKMGHVTKLLS